MFAKAPDGTQSTPVRASIQAVFLGPYLNLTCTDNRPAGDPPHGYPSLGSAPPDFMITATSGQVIIDLGYGNFTASDLLSGPEVSVHDASAFLREIVTTPTQVVLKAASIPDREKAITVTVSMVVRDAQGTPKTVTRSLVGWFDVPGWGKGW